MAFQALKQLQNQIDKWQNIDSITSGWTATPVPNLRTKCCIKEFDEFPTLEQLPEWGFDGSSTQQADGATPVASLSRWQSSLTEPAKMELW